MNGIKGKNTELPKPPEGERERLFAKITAELDVRPQEKGRRRNYRVESAIRYALPRLLGVTLLLALLLLVFTYLHEPVGLKDLERSLTERGERISFQATKPALMKSVSASLNGAPLPVEREDGSYCVYADSNGRLSLTMKSILGSVWTDTLSVEGIDSEAPHVVSHGRAAGGVRIFLSDGEDGSGVDWPEITAARADNGQPYPVGSCDEAEGFVSFAMPDTAILISVPDRQGNLLSITLSPPPSP